MRQVWGLQVLEQLSLGGRTLSFLLGPSDVVGTQISSAQHEDVSMAESCQKTEGPDLIGSVFRSPGSRH